MSEATTVYATPTIAAPALPKIEVFTEVRCPACVPLGWETSRLLFKVYGAMNPSGAKIQVRCHRCRSLVSWTIGLPLLETIERGPKNTKRQRVVFE